MKSYLKTGFVLIHIVCFSALAHADLKVSDAWVKPTTPGQPVAGAYMTLTSDKDLEIVELQSPVAGKTEIHSMSMDGNIMRMKRVERLPVKAGKQVELKPGGYHVMLMELNHQIKEGQTIPINLVTQDQNGKRQTIAVKAVATSPKDAESPSDQHMHH